jgi:hypothetical protein
MGILNKYAELLDSFQTKENIKDKVILSICNFTRGKSCENGDCQDFFLIVILPMLKYVKSCNSETQIKLCLYSFYKFSYVYKHDVISQFINQEFFSFLSENIFKYDKIITLYICKLFTNMLAGPDEETEMIINFGIIPIYSQILENFTNTDAFIIKECLWGCSNIAAGSINSIQLLIDQKILTHTLRILNHYIIEDAQYMAKEILKEAFHLLTNTITGCTPEHQYLLFNNEFNFDILSILCEGLNTFDNERRLIYLILMSLKFLLLLEENEKYIVQVKGPLLKFGFLEYLEKFSDEYPDLTVNEVSQQIIQEYFMQIN